MRILYYLEPYLDLVQPYVMHSWLERFHRMHEQLKIFADDYEGRLLAWEAYEYKLQGPFQGEKITLKQSDLRLNWRLAGAPLTYLEWGGGSDEHVTDIQHVIRSSTKGFSPDVVVLLSVSEWLRPVFPNALFLHSEATWLYALPQFNLWQLDPVGFGKGRVLLEHRDELIGQLAWDDDKQLFCDRLKRAVADLWRTNTELSEAVDSVRKNFDRLVLVPLGDYAPTDGVTPVMTILDWYLEQQDPRTAFLITHHPNAPALYSLQSEYLTAKYPNLIVNALFKTTLMLSLVDEVLGDFTSASSMALLFDKPVRSLGDHCPFTSDRFKVRSPLCRWLENNHDPVERDRMLYWLLTRYSIPQERLHNGIWLSDFMSRVLAAYRAGKPWQVFDQSIVSEEEWATRPWFVAALNDQSCEVDPVEVAARALAREHCHRYEEAGSLLEQDQTEQALEMLRDLVKSETKLWEPYNDLAVAAANSGDLLQAEKLLKDALRVDPSARQVRLNLVSVEIALEQFEQALAELGPLMRSEPTNPEIFNLARDILGVAPALSTIAWIRLVADIRAPKFS